MESKESKQARSMVNKLETEFLKQHKPSVEEKTSFTPINVRPQSVNLKHPKTKKKQEKLAVITKQVQSSKLVNPKYQLPITKTREITQQHIESIGELVEQGNFIESACWLSGVDPEAFFILVSNRTGNELSQYAETAIKSAQAKAESMFIERMLDPQNYNNANIKALSQFLETVNPKFHRKYKIQMEYELAIILDLVKAHVAPEDYLKILDSMRSTDSKEIVASLDSKLRE